jgi:hypothetical protein
MLDPLPRLRRFVEEVVGIQRPAMQDAVRWFDDFLRAGPRAFRGEAPSVAKHRSGSACTIPPEPEGLRLLQGEFSSIIYAMAVSELSLRERLRWALEELSPVIARGSDLDRTTTTAWQALLLAFDPDSGRDILSKMTDDDVRKALDGICNIDARLRWLVR